MSDQCLFCQTIQGEIPARIVYQDEICLAFLDIRPNSPGHTLIIPKQHCRNLLDMSDGLLTEIMPRVKKVAQAVKSGMEAPGFNLTMNNEPAAGQIIFHAHFHIIPRFADDELVHWKHAKLDNPEMDSIQNKIKQQL